MADQRSYWFKHAKGPYSPTHQQHHGCFSTNELLLSLFLRVVGGREALLSGWSLPMNQLSGGDLSRCCGLTLGALSHL